ncbi:hypothetical protein [Palleronia sp. LCG004]|uniref:hypothetical protein n=1 Tax=Palleronia sp. LCG004 TaxID=3079304 RepID=UPI0029432DC9|nr:hypothetical protein [Palleronia sp. LCG004]WOI57521.1 hypothetical protein RVY76_06990 [Palleronia sp. LCG004]
MPFHDIARQDRYGPEVAEYRLMLITDEDKASQVTLDDGETYFMAHLRYWTLTRRDGRYSFEAVPEIEGGEEHVYSKFGEVDRDTFRGGEFSELVKWGRHMMVFDDRTGIVGEVRGEDHTIIPRQILMTGPGDALQKGFKCEWATLKGDDLIVGSHGKRPSEEWVKRIDASYRVESLDWGGIYRKMREAFGVGEEGYVVHEAAEWHPLRGRWYFFPRKISTTPFDEPIDEREKGNNLLLEASEDFSDIRILPVGERVPERGPSSLKIVPGRPEEFVYMKSVEIGDHTESWIGAASLDGTLLADEVKVGDFKCEGIEFT